MLPRHQEEVVSLDAGRAAPLDRLLLARQQAKLQRLDDRLRNLVLKLEDVGQVAVVALGPHMVSGRAVNQLCSDPDPGRRFADASFKDVLDAQLASDFSAHPRHVL